MILKEKTNTCLSRIQIIHLKRQYICYIFSIFRISFNLTTIFKNIIQRIYELLNFEYLNRSLEQLIVITINHMLTKQQLKINLLTHKSKQKNPQMINYERSKQEIVKQLLSFRPPHINNHIQSQKVDSLLSFFKRKTDVQVRHKQLTINQNDAEIEYPKAQSRIYISDHSSKYSQEEPKQRICLNEYFIKTNKKVIQAPLAVVEKESLEEIGLQIQNTINLCINSKKTESQLDFRAVSKIQDESKFKREMQEEKQRKKQLVLAQSIKKRQKTQKLSIFNGCPAKVFSSPQNTTNYETKIIEANELKDMSEVEDFSQKQEKFNFFDFLKGKITNLARKENEKKQKQNPIKSIQFVEIISVKNKTEVIKSKQPQNNQSIASMKPQLSQSDSSSFFKEKQKIEQKGILNVDLRDIVDSSVKQVQANLQKVEENKRRIDKGDIINKINITKSVDRVDNVEKVESQKSKLIEKAINKIHSQQSRQSAIKTIQILNNQNSVKKGSEIKESQESKIKKIFGDSKKSQEKIIQKKEIPENNSQLKSITEFFAAQKSKPYKVENLSQPSTVQKNQQRSIEFSDVFNHLNFEQIKESEINSNLFQKNEESKNIKREEVNLERVLSDLHEQKSVELSEYKLFQNSQQLSQNKLNEKSLQLSEKKLSDQNQQLQEKNLVQKSLQISEKKPSEKSQSFQLSKIQTVVKNKKEININLMNLPQVSLSFDAFSFSKLSNLTERQDSHQPTLNSFKAMSNAKQPIKQIETINIGQSKLQQNNQKIIIPLLQQVATAGTRGRVQKIEINLDSDSSDDNTSKQEDSDSEIDLDDIKDYDSDDQNNDNPKQIPIGKSKVNLTPIIQEDLEESQLMRQNTNIKNISKQELKKMQDPPLLPEIKMTKIKSEDITVQQVEKTQKTENKLKVIKLVKPPIKKISLTHNLSEPENSSISNLSMTSEKDISKTEKELIESIKGGIEGLKEKMSSIILSDSDKSVSKIINKSQYSDVKQISIDLGSFTQNFKKQGQSQSESNDLTKLMKKKSSHKNISSNLDKKTSEKQSKKIIIFEQLDASVEQDLYKQFKQNFMSLKKRVEEDHRML